MENEKGILEVLIESLKTQDRIVEAHDRMVKAQDQMAKAQERMIVELKETNHRLYVIETKSDKVEEQLVKLNLNTGENSRAILKLADNVEQIADLHNRVTKLEKTVYK
jgi:GTP-binding protein EngB required for normal cell division